MGIRSIVKWPATVVAAALLLAYPVLAGIADAQTLLAIEGVCLSAAVVSMWGWQQPHKDKPCQPSLIEAGVICFDAILLVILAVLMLWQLLA